MGTVLRRAAPNCMIGLIETLNVEKDMKSIALVYTFGDLNKESAFLGGAERRINYIFSNISNPNLDIELVFVLRKNRDSVLKMLEVYIKPETKITIVDSYWKVFTYLVKNHFDVVCYVDCALQTIPAILGGIAGRSKRIMIIESSNRAYGVFKRGAKERILMDWNYRLSNQLDTLYPSSKEKLEKKYGDGKRTITVTPCTLPRIDRYTRVVPKKNYILFAGRLIENKNPELFARAAIKCADKLRETGYICLLCGDGPLKEKVADIISQFGCDDVVAMKGYVNMEEVTPECRIFCSLQHTENYPSQSLLEAITSGCYCICTNPGDTNVIVRPEFGELIEENVDALASAFSKALAFDSGKWAEVEKHARAFALENFDVQKAVRHYEKIFLEG